MNHDRRLIIIGLDGATFDILDPYAREGVMPNTRDILAGGARGPLESTTPPVTGPAWVSFMTGVLPGKHGIYDFVTPVAGTMKRRPITYADIRTPTLWTHLGRAGKKVGIVNLPITYPIPEVDGFVIPGMLTPVTEGEYAYPHGLMAEISAAVGDYVFDVYWHQYGRRGANRFLDDLMRTTEQRTKTIRYLLANKEWDVFAGIITETDRMQHFLWPYIVGGEKEGGSRLERKLVQRVREYYGLLDSFIGEVRGSLDGSTDMIFVSDHGFGPLHRKMYMNRWLADHGHLSADWQAIRRGARRRRIYMLARAIVRALDPLGLRKTVPFLARRRNRMSAYSFLDRIDWTRTAAYSVSNTEQGIYLNVRGREPRGIVAPEDYNKVRSEIMKQLKELRDPDTEEPMNVQVFAREDLYKGPEAERAPDIVAFVEQGEVLVDSVLKETLFEDANWSSGLGTHRMDGILIGYGPSFAAGTRVEGASIADVTPTILYQQGLPVPKYADGEVLTAMFSKDFASGRHVAYADDERAAGDPPNRYVGSGSAGDGETDLEIEKRLKGLGYL